MAQDSAFGTGVPPQRLVEPDLVPTGVHDGAHRLLEVLGQRDGVGFRVEHRHVAIAFDERGGQWALGQAAHLDEHLASGVGVEIGKLPLTEHLVDPEHFEKVELLVAHVGLVVAHYVLLDEECHFWADIRLGTPVKLPTSNQRNYTHR